MTTYAIVGAEHVHLVGFTSGADFLVRGYPIGRCLNATVQSAGEILNWYVPKGGWIEVCGQHVKGPANGIAPPDSMNEETPR